MRAVVLAVLFVGAGLGVACVHDGRTTAPAVQGVAPVASAPARTPSLLASSYLLADAAATPVAGAPFAVEHEGSVCVLVDGLRVRVDGGALRMAEDVAEPPLLGAHVVPAWLGGGLLFRSRHVLYRASRCEGRLEPVVSLPGTIDDLAFGPRFALVRGDDGQIWPLDLPSGAPMAAAPVGLVDVVADGAGRSLALDERGRLLFTSDAAVGFQDGSAFLNGPVASLLSTGTELWAAEAGGTAHRLDGAGLVSFDRLPTAKAARVRPLDERWRGSETALRRALRLGVPTDDGGVLLLESGEALRLDAATGLVALAAPAPVPPDALCEGVRTASGPLFVCLSAHGGGVTLVVAVDGTTLGTTLETSLPRTDGAFASDDGSLAFVGPCGAGGGKLTACVRGTHGTWREVDAAVALGADGGVVPSSVRWVPRADGGAYALFADPQPTFVDVRTSESHTPNLEGAPTAVRSLFGEPRSSSSSRSGGHVLDRSVTATVGGALRAWLDDGTSVELAADGAVRASPYAFPRLGTAGPFALARTRDGRTWQSTDHGAAWAEVAAPPSARAGGFVEVRGCSPVGCDLGSFYRLGWSTAPPPVSLPFVTAPAAMRFVREPRPVLACVATTDARRQERAQHGEHDAGDLGLGHLKAPTLGRASDVEREVHNRGLVHPVGDSTASGGGDEGSAPRALLWARAPSMLDDDMPEVAKIAKLRGELHFVPPFDPAAPVRRAALLATDLQAFARRTSLTFDEAFGSAGWGGGVLVPITPKDAASPSELGLASVLPWVAVVRPTGATRLYQRLRRGDDARLLSAVRLDEGTVALLEGTEGGGERVALATAGGASVVFELAPGNGVLSYPENPDALAIGPRGELAVLRVRSGAEPPSARQPAILLSPSGAVTALAPWSSLALETDPACRTDRSGYRATVAARGSWLALETDGPASDDESPFFMRVRWSPSRVCLEAVELRAADALVPVRESARGDVTIPPQSVETWVVARFAPGLSAARVGIGPGVELREPLSCALKP